jgi:hypothetical protein
MASDKVFQSESLFDYLPSYWKGSFGDKPVLETVYEALSRSMDVDWVRTFATNDTKDIGSAPVTVTHPLVHQKLGNWASLGVPHAHFHAWYAWPAAAGTPETYTIRVEDHVLERPQLFLDGRAIPSFVYRLNAQHWVESGVVKYGTTITFDKAELDSFLDGSYLTVPDQTNENTSQEWVPSDLIQRVGVLAYRDNRPFTGAGDGSSLSYDLLLGADTAVIEPFDALAVIESVDVTQLVTVAAVTAGFTVTPKVKGGFGAGMLLQVTYDDDTQAIQELQTGSETLTFRTNATSVTGVRLFVDIPLGADHYEVTTEGVALVTGATFPGGSTIRVKDAGGIQSRVLERPRAKVTFDRPIDPASAQVLYQGTSLLETAVEESAVTFVRPLASGARWRIDAPIITEHDHALYRTATDGTDTVTVPTTRPFALSGGAFQADFPVLVWLDGVLQDPDTYSPADSITLTLDTAYPTGITVDIWYVDAEDPLEHLHNQLSEVVPLTVPEQYSVHFETEATFDDNRWPLTVYRDGFLENDPDQLVTVDGQFIQFADALTPGISALVDGVREEFRYSHIIPKRTDIDYGYEGWVYSIGTVQDGVSAPTTTLVDGAGFSYEPAQTSADDAVLKASVSWDEAWLTSVEVDEHTLRRVWGEPVGITQGRSTLRYRDMLVAIYAAYRGPSFVDSLVNFSSILLGSAYLPTAGLSQGIKRNADGTRVLIQPTNTRKAPVYVELIDGAPVRVKPAPQIMDRLYAVNELITVNDRDLDSVPWLAYMAQDLSEDYVYAKRLDVRSASVLTSTPAGYNPDSHVLTDYSVNFYDEEVWVGDLVKLSLVSTQSPVSSTVTYTPDTYGSKDAVRLVYNATTTPPRLHLHVASPALSAWGTGYYISLTGAGSPWDTASDEVYTIITSSPGAGLGGSTLIKADWLDGHAAPSFGVILSSPYPQVAGVLIEQSSSTPTIIEDTMFSTVTAVLDAHNIVVPVSAGVEALGYGDKGYGQYGYGGSILRRVPSGYTLWSRRTRTLDTYLSLDTALDQSTAVVPGENVQLINQQLAPLLKHHVFTVELSWDQMVDRDVLDNLGVLIQGIKPAETRALVYTEAFPGGELIEVMAGSFIDGSPTLDQTLADSLFMGESWLTANSISLLGPELNYLYRPWQHRFGPRLESQLKTPPSSPQLQGFYLVGQESQIDHTGLWAKTFDSAHGLEGQVLQYQSPGNWIVNNGFSPSAGYALDLTSGTRRIRAGAGSLTQLHAAQTLSYTAGDELSAHAVVYIATGAHSSPTTVYVGGMSPSLFQLGFVVGSPDTLQPLFQAHSSETLALGSPSAGYYDRWVALTGVYREGAGGYWYSDLYVDGALAATSSPTDSPNLTVVPTTSTTLVLGGPTSALESPVSFKGLLDEYRLYTGTELSSPEILSLWNSGAPVMPTFGIDAVTGSPIVPSGITAWYRGYRHLGAKVVDLSGQGYVGTKITQDNGDELQDWRVAGLTLTNFPAFGDTFEVKPGGYYISQGVITATQLGIPPSLLSSPDYASAGTDQIAGQSTGILTMFGFNDVLYSNPTPWLHYKDTEGWILSSSNPQAPGSALALDEDPVFLGYSSPGEADYSPLASDLTITGSRLTLTAAASNAGAITQITLDGQPLLNNKLKGRMTQWSCEYSGRGFSRLVNEAGKLNYSPAETSNSVFLSSSASTASMRTSSYLGHAFGTLTYAGESYQTSATKLNKHVELGFLANPNVIKVSAHFERDSSTKDGAWRSQFSVGLVPSLNKSWLYRPGYDTNPVPTSFTGTINYPTNWVGGTIISNADQDEALGIFHRRPATETGWFQSQILPSASTAISSPLSESYTLLNDQEFLGQKPGVPIGSFRTERYIVAGTLVEVVGAFNQLAYVLEDIEPPITGPEPASHIVITAAPDPMTLGDTFSISAQAQGPGGLVDQTYNQPALVSLISNTASLTGTTTVSFSSGEVTFSGLSIDTTGGYSIEVSSGMLAPGSASVQVNNPVPYATSPTSFSMSPAEGPLTLHGVDFMPSSYVRYSSWTGSPDPYTSTLTYVSSSEVQFTPPTEILSASPQTLSLAIYNPGPGGGATAQIPLTIESPAAPTPTVPSPVADLLQFTKPVASNPLFPRVGQTTLIAAQAVDSSLAYALDADATGSVTLSPASTPAGAVISGTLTQSLGTAIPGYVFFAGLSFDTAGEYVLNALHESPLVIAPTSPSLTLTVLNNPPTLTSLVPDNADEGTQSLTLRVLGSNYVEGDSQVLWAGFPRTTTYVSPGELNVSLGASDFLVPQSLGVSVNTAQGGGPSGALTFTINGGPTQGLDEQTLSPSIIVLSPSAYQRVLPSTGNVVTTPAGWALHRALEQTGVATAGAPIHFNDGSMGATGAIEVIEVRAGSYEKLGTSNSAYSGGTSNKSNVGLSHAPSAAHPLVIRAAKWTVDRAPELELVGFPEPVVLNSTEPDYGSTDMIFHDRSLESSNWHWYDITMFLGSRGGLLIKDNKKVSVGGTTGINQPEDPTIPWLGWHLHRWRVLGRYDHRVYRLDHDRWIVGPQDPTIHTIKQYDTSGNEIVAKDWLLDDLHRARFGKRLSSSNTYQSDYATLTSVPEGQVTGLHFAVFADPADTMARLGTAASAGTQLVHPGVGILDIFQSGLSPVDFFQQFGTALLPPFNILSSPNQYASPPSLNYTWDVAWTYDGTFAGDPGQGGSVQFYDRTDYTTLTASTTLTTAGSFSVPLTQGVGTSYLSMTGRGCFAFKATLKDQWGNAVEDPANPDSTLTRNALIQVTQHGMSDSPSTVAVAYDVPDTHLSWFGYQNYNAQNSNVVAGPFSLVLEARTDQGQLSMEVDGTVRVAVKSFKTVEGTTIPGTHAVNVGQQDHPMRGGVCHVANLFPFVGVTPYGLKSFLDANSAAAYGIMTLSLTPFGGTGLDAQEFTYDVGVWPSVGDQFGQSPGELAPPQLTLPWSIRQTDPTWLGPDLDDYPLSLAPSNTVKGIETNTPTNAKVKTAIGLPFWAGWPGDPTHPNYRPGYENLWPNPAHCPGLVYPGYPELDIAPKWGIAPFYTKDWIFDSGVIMNIGIEHAVYAHNQVGDTTFSNTKIYRTGRTACQMVDRLPENPYFNYASGILDPNDTGGPGAGLYHLKNLYIEETGLNDGGGTFTINGHGADGECIIENCLVRQGYDDQIAAHNYVSGTGLFPAVMTLWGEWYPGYAGNAFTLGGMGFKDDGYQQWNPFLVKKDGTPVFSFQGMIEHVVNKREMTGEQGTVGGDGTPKLTPKLYTDLLFGGPMMSYNGTQPLGLDPSDPAAGIEPPVYTGAVPDTVYGMGSPTYGSFHQIGTVSLLDNTFEMNHPNKSGNPAITWAEPLPSLNPYGAVYSGTSDRYSNAPGLILGACRILKMNNNTFHHSNNQVLNIDETTLVWTSPGAKAANDPRILITKNAAIWQILGGNNTIVAPAYINRYSQQAPQALFDQLTSPST